MGRIVEILDALKIIKSKAMRRIKDNTSTREKYITTPKIFADYRHFTKDSYGNQVIDKTYNCDEEIEKQIKLLENNNI